MNETLCKFCGGAEPYARPEKSKEALKIISTDNPGRTRKSWTGIYDDELVCRACEDRWDSWDAYGIDFLRNIEKYAKPILSEGRLLGYQSDDYDYGQLKLFFLSVA